MPHRSGWTMIQRGLTGFPQSEKLRFTIIRSVGSRNCCGESYSAWKNSFFRLNTKKKMEKTIFFVEEIKNFRNQTLQSAHAALSTIKLWARRRNTTKLGYHDEKIFSSDSVVLEQILEHNSPTAGAASAEMQYLIANRELRSMKTFICLTASPKLGWKFYIFVARWTIVGILNIGGRWLRGMRFRLDLTLRAELRFADEAENSLMTIFMIGSFAIVFLPPARAARATIESDKKKHCFSVLTTAAAELFAKRRKINIFFN